MKKIEAIAFVPLLILSVVWTLPAQDNDICLSCHGQKMEVIPFVNTQEFAKSIHARNLCISCHADAKEIPHPQKLDPVSCSKCHRIESSIYLKSDHGRALSKGVSEAATCTSCHGKTHTLLSSRDPQSPVHRKNIPRTCATCHADKDKMSKFRLTEKEPFDTYLHSIHGQAFNEGKLNAAVCSDCHGTHDLHASSNPDSKVFRANVPQTCGRCHENVREVYDRSIHGKAIKAGIKESPVCTDCHGEHTIRSIKDPASSVYSGAITKTCAACHDSEKINQKFGLPTDRMKTYQGSYHGLAAMGGDLHVANCASCHGWHDILPSYDTQSAIHSKNLPNTCGKCHPGAQVKLVHGSIHGSEKSDRHWILRLVELFYLILIPLVVGGMFLHNFADYLKKAFSPEVFHGLGHDTEVLRLNVDERIQHGLLMVAFIILGYSGFALKYPEAWWAEPFAMVGGEALRKGIHRWTAFFFVLLGVYHILYMIFTKKGRYRLTHDCLPRLKDILGPFHLVAYNVGLRKEKPDLTYPSYIEKMEYWALVWGSIIMIVTGSLLVFSDYTLKYFPLWVSDLATMIHFYEAVLACLSIVVWHLYWVMFDPELYPMNWAWIVGKVRRHPNKPREKDKRS